MDVLQKEQLYVSMQRILSPLSSARKPLKIQEQQTGNSRIAKTRAKLVTSKESCISTVAFKAEGFPLTLVGFDSNPAILHHFVTGNSKTSRVQKQLKKLCSWYAPLRQLWGEKHAIISFPLAIPGCFQQPISTYLQFTCLIYKLIRPLSQYLVFLVYLISLLYLFMFWGICN